MKILWFTWKDQRHPLAGGAEVVNEELAKRLIKDGHEVIFIVGGFAGGKSKETVNGFNIIRLGNRYSVYWRAYKYYKKHLQGWPDIVIEEINTIPFFTKFYVQKKSFLFIHQLARQVWFYQMVFPFSLIGFWLEWLYLRILAGQKVITVSESTKQDLQRFGFQAKNIAIISEGIELTPIKDLDTVKKYKNPTVLSLGAIRPMKRTDQQIKAFEIAKRSIPNLQLKIAGDASSAYGRKVLKMIRESPYANDIEYLGRVPKSQKIALMQKSHVILVTSVKEGWGLIVTEAASQGTPAIVYNVDGLRDSVQYGKSGLITAKNTPRALAVEIQKLFKDKQLSAKIRHDAYEFSTEVNFGKSYIQFKQSMGLK